MRSLLIPLFLLAVSCQGANDSPRPDDGLPVTGIAGPAAADLKIPHVVAHLLPDGSITLDGQPVEPEHLEEAFEALAPKPKSVDGWPAPNPVALVIRADGATSWQRVRDLLYDTGRPQNIQTVLFSVRHAGDGEEGTFLLGLPGGFADNRSDSHYLRTTGRFTEPAPPAAILAALAEPRRGILIDLHPATPLSYALGLLDVLSQDGLSDEGGAWTVLAREEGARVDLAERKPGADVAAALREALAEPIDDDDPRRFLARAAKWLF